MLQKLLWTMEEEAARSLLQQQDEKKSFQIHGRQVVTCAVQEPIHGRHKMKKRTNLHLALRLMIACSLCGSLAIVMMVTCAPATSQDDFWRKPLFGSIFFLLCVGGSLVAVSPRNCSVTHETRTTTKTLRDADVKTGSHISSEGHHPNCGKFRAHTIRFRGTSYCAACTGLLIGGVVAMVLTALYFFLGLNSVFFSFPAIAVGLLGLGSGLIQFKLRSWTRSAANLLFALGGALTLIGVDQLVGSVFVDSYATGLIVLWILTRVMISQEDHHGICIRCGFLCVTKRKVGVLPSATQPVQSADHN